MAVIFEAHATYPAHLKNDNVWREYYAIVIRAFYVNKEFSFVFMLSFINIVSNALQEQSGRMQASTLQTFNVFSATLQQTKRCI